ncbi:hypothetical protein PRUPE_4G015300 [Prunus persica]|uniref:Large ribosomal subunit protein uL4m n=1 Tax=Prunus persica TaxID=3760 RepID=A0A251PE58_PRUPE|nr:hypothetical protein PRUPE_4G015300 [Prunus persica]
MALSVSRRLLRSFGSVLASGHCDSPSSLYPSLHASHDLCGHVLGDILFCEELSPFSKARSSFLANRRLLTSISTPESSGGAFPSNLLSAKPVVASEGTIGTRKGHKTLLGTHSTKTISEVSGTGRKPWNQKGTGRARQGSLRSPQFRGGSTMHGPKPRSHAFKLNKKLLVFDDFEVPTHKTKNIVNYVQQMDNSKKLLLLATQNLHYVNVLPAVGLNVNSILQHDTLVMSRAAVNEIVERMHTPIKR